MTISAPDRVEDRLFVAGKFAPASDEGTFETLNPATGSSIASVAHATSVDVERAVEAARQAQSSWANAPLMERARVLRKAAKLIESNAEDLAILESLDAGKPITDCRAQVHGSGPTTSHERTGSPGTSMLASYM